MKQYPSQARLRELFDYEDGVLTRKDGRYQSNITVSPKHKTIRNRTWLSGFEYLTKELVWIYHNGDIPNGKRVKSKAGSYSSKIEDLFLSEMTGNLARVGKKKENSTSQYVGVHRQGDLWVVQFSFERNRSDQYKGQFTSEIAAAACYNFWAKRLFGDHAALNDVPAEFDFEKYRRTQKMPARKPRCSSGFKGVYQNKSRWMARIKKHYIGTFDTKEQAARAYNIAAYEHYGENAVLNNIPDPLGKGDVF